MFKNYRLAEGNPLHSLEGNRNDDILNRKFFNKLARERSRMITSEGSFKARQELISVYDHSMNRYLLWKLFNSLYVNTEYLIGHDRQKKQRKRKQRRHV